MQTGLHRCQHAISIVYCPVRCDGVVVYIVVQCFLWHTDGAKPLCCQQAVEEQQAAHVATGVPMTDLERQFFANSQPDDSSDSSSESDQESMNAASEDDEDDGLDHF